MKGWVLVRNVGSLVTKERIIVTAEQLAKPVGGFINIDHVPLCPLQELKKGRIQQCRYGILSMIDKKIHLVRTKQSIVCDKFVSIQRPDHQGYEMCCGFMLDHIGSRNCFYEQLGWQK